MNDAGSVPDLVVGRVELMEALSRRTKMKRAPNGVLSSGLKEAAFIPALSGIRVEMPGGSHFVWVIDGELYEEVVFDAKFVDSLAKVLVSQATETDARLEVAPNVVVLRCGSSKVTIPRKLKAKRRT
ncbi:hypothetical protein QKW60_12295 [Defluviimonas aestuarii]|uniref:hypothetical protein n=1 Tax=Albidovulum aestuarii TaxID=1130726 RepID=UPI00249C1026|nr:hypothetical protein [Defluviimonas aestuarii]MDI3337193.1 hypothetical protein [Defluviimonas aestuarii]